jgi:hypothetical protein
VRGRRLGRSLQSVLDAGVDRGEHLLADIDADHQCGVDPALDHFLDHQHHHARLGRR